MERHDFWTHIGVVVAMIVIIAIPTVARVGLTLYSAFFFVVPAAITFIAWVAWERAQRPAELPALWGPEPSASRASDQAQRTLIADIAGGSSYGRGSCNRNAPVALSG